MKLYHLILYIFLASASYGQSFLQNPFNGHKIEQPVTSDMDNDGKVDALGYRIQNLAYSTGDLQIFNSIIDNW